MAHLFQCSVLSIAYFTCALVPILTRGGEPDYLGWIKMWIGMMLGYGLGVLNESIIARGRLRASFEALANMEKELSQALSRLETGVDVTPVQNSTSKE